VFKERRFLVGFGAGIIVGGLLLQLMLTGQQGPSNLMNSGERIYTEQEVEQLIEKAKEEAVAGQGDEQPSIEEGAADGTATVKPSAPEKPSAPSAPADSADLANADTPSGPQKPNQPATGQAEQSKEPDTGQVEQPGQPGQPVAPERPDAPDAPADEAPVVIRIEPGMNLTQTARMLADNGIITSSDAFIAKMKKDKKLVRAGFFAFSGQPTLQQTVDTLTGQPLTEAEANRIKSKS